MSLDELKTELLKSAAFRQAYYRHDIAYEVARMLLEARVKQGFTQEKLAKAIGTTQSSIARAEQGKHAVSLDFLEKIAKAYKTYLVAPHFAFMDGILAVESRTNAARIGLIKDLSAIQATVVSPKITGGSDAEHYFFSTDKTESGASKQVMALQLAR